MYVTRIAYLAIALLTSTLVQARTVVVKDELPINVRDGIETPNRIIGSAWSGERLPVLEEKPGYVRVRTPRGKEGWVLARFVQEGPVHKELLAAERSQREADAERLQNLTAQLQARDDTIAELQARMAQLQSQGTVAGAGAGSLAPQNAGSGMPADEAQTPTARQWLLAAGILLVGLLLGLIIPQLRSSQRRGA